MSSWGLVAPDEEPQLRRVREEVKDGAAVVALSAAASTVIAVALMLLMKLAG
jgi:hypothetical protein